MTKPSGKLALYFSRRASEEDVHEEGQEESEYISHLKRIHTSHKGLSGNNFLGLTSKAFAINKRLETEKLILPSPFGLSGNNPCRYILKAKSICVRPLETRESLILFPILIRKSSSLIIPFWPSFFTP